jgi:hypothetical protein
MGVLENTKTDGKFPLHKIGYTQRAANHTRHGTVFRSALGTLHYLLDKII